MMRNPPQIWNGNLAVKSGREQSPSMRRPVDVKAHFDFLLSVSLLPLSQAASVAILPFALFCERFSLGAHWVFSFQ
jgi:hypothetical protein